MAKSIPVQVKPTLPILPSILPAYNPNQIQAFYPKNLVNFFKDLIMPKALKNEPNIDAVIFELLRISIEAHFKLPRTPFADFQKSNLADFFISKVNVMPSDSEDPSAKVKLEDLVETKVGGQTILKFETFENIFNFLFATMSDQISLARTFDARSLDTFGDAKQVLGLFQIRLVKFYQDFPNMKKIYDNVYITIISIGLYLLNIAQKDLGTFKDAVFTILPKTISRSGTEYVEKTAINTIISTTKPFIQESVNLDSINVYRDLQAIYDCSLSFLPFHVIAQKFQNVQNRLGNTQFLQQQIATLLENSDFREYLQRLQVSPKTASQSVGALSDEVRETTYDEMAITRSLILLVILCIDAFVQDQSFYAQIYNKQGLWKFFKEIPRLKKIDFSSYADKFLRIYRTELDAWNFHAWNTDGSVRSAKNLVLKPVGPSPRRANLQISSAALILDPLFKDTSISFDTSLDAFVGRTFYDVYKSFRAGVFVTSFYFDIKANEYLQKEFDLKVKQPMSVQAVYLFLVYCQYRIKDYALQHATLFEKTDVIESPNYSNTRDVARQARYDSVYSPIFRITLAMTSIILIDKLVTKNRKNRAQT